MKAIGDKRSPCRVSADDEYQYEDGPLTRGDWRQEARPVLINGYWLLTNVGRAIGAADQWLAGSLMLICITDVCWAALFLAGGSLATVASTTIERWQRQQQQQLTAVVVVQP